MQLNQLQRWLARTVPMCPFYVRCPGGVVSFTFDDFPRSALTAGGEILQSQGVAGTYYACATLADRRSDGIEQFHRADIEALLGAGHELACHTDSHLNCQTAHIREIDADCKQNTEAFKDELDGRQLTNFAYPLGCVSLSAKRYIGRQFSTGRGIRPGVNTGLSDRPELRACALYKDRMGRDQIDSLINEARSKGGWLIFYTHDVTDAPSPYGCSPDLIEYAVQYSQKAGCHIRTMQEAFLAVAATR